MLPSMQGAMPEGYVSMLKRVGCRKARQATVGQNPPFDKPARIVDNSVFPDTPMSQGE